MLVRLHLEKHQLEELKQWKVELFAENMTNERAELFINDQDDTMRIATNRPFTLSLRVSYDL